MMDCDEYVQRRVKLGYVPDAPTSVQLVDSIGNQIFDLLPIIQAGETDTSIALLTDTRRIRYYPEVWTRSDGKEGCYYDICIPDIAALIDLNELRNIDSPETLETGDTIVYNSATHKYEMYNLYDALQDLQDQIDAGGGSTSALERRVSTLERQIREQNQKIAELTELVATYNQRISDIENAIYNWTNDKNTKIPRANINVTSGGYSSGNGIFSRATNTNEDLNFS